MNHYSYQLSRLYSAEHAKGRRLYLRCKNIFKPLDFFHSLLVWCAERMIYKIQQKINMYTNASQNATFSP